MVDNERSTDILWNIKDDLNKGHLCIKGHVVTFIFA